MLMIKHFLNQGLSKKFGTHVFVMVIFQKIMPSWDMGMFLDAMRYMKVRV